MKDKVNLAPIVQKDETKEASEVGQGIDFTRLAACHNDGVAHELIAAAAIAHSMCTAAEKLKFLAQTLTECGPRDINEARLCLQVSILYSEGMNYLAKANGAKTIDHAEFYMKSSIKLLRLHNETLDAWSRYRRGGEQKVIVQHVNVNEGGQAIVGHVQTGGGGN